MRWEWLLPGASVCALLGWVMRRSGPPRLQLAGRVLLIGGLSVVATVVALYAAFLALLIYFPVTWVFDDGWPLTVAVCTQAALMFVAIVIALRRSLLGRLPVLVFAVVTLGFSAWLHLNRCR
ncbi:hypothetical protein [Mycolicibacterium fortuitum]